MSNTNELVKIYMALSAIAEGYEIKVRDDRYISVENPEYRFNHYTEEPFLVLDMVDVFSTLLGTGKMKVNKL